MIIFNWNISYSSQIEKIWNEIKKNILNEKTFIITLQEVIPSSYQYLKEILQKDYNLVYSLNYRIPGKFDTRSRKLGTMIITSKNIKIINSNVFDRTLLPDRTLFATLKLNNKIIKVATLHSITGCDHKKAKSLQFYSFAEIIDTYRPNILTIDANEPEIDHFDINEMKFFDNSDKGNGAKTFFKSCQNIGLKDSYTQFYDKTKFEIGKPLATSHIIGYNKNKRYDFLFIDTTKFNIKQVNYEIDKAKIATSDHAYIKCQIE